MLVEKIFPNREEYEAHQESILESVTRSHSQNFITSIKGKKIDHNSNHLNNEHLIHLNTELYGCPVFKWSNHMTWQTILILDIFDRKLENKGHLMPLLKK